MGNAVRFKNTDIPRQNGELARFKVVRGPDYGAVYILLASPATIGRGEDNDLVISDLKASRHHAKIEWSAQLGCKVIDHASANGILHNNQKVKEARLKFSDTISLGETLLEYVPSDVGTQILRAPARKAEEIQAEQEKLEKLKEERFGLVSLKTLLGGFKKGSTPQAGTQGNKKNLLLFIALGAAAFLLLGEDPDPSKKPPAKPAANSAANSNNASSLSAYLPISPDTARTIETLYKEGMREYFGGNYSRAKTQFETILEISPTHPLANLYLQNCDVAIKSSVKKGLEQGKKAYEAGKLREARAAYSQVLRYLYRDRDNPSYKEAKEQLELVNKTIREGVSDL